MINAFFPLLFKIVSIVVIVGVIVFFIKKFRNNNR